MNFLSLNGYTHQPFSYQFPEVNIFNQEEQTTLQEEEIRLLKEKEIQLQENQFKKDKEEKKRKKANLKLKVHKIELNCDNSVDFKIDIKSIACLGEYEENLLAIGFKNGKLEYFNIKKLLTVSEFKAHDIEVINISYPKKYNKDTLITQSKTEIRLWDISTNKIICELKDNCQFSAICYIGNFNVNHIISGHISQIKHWALKSNEEDGSPLIATGNHVCENIKIFLHLVNYNSFVLLSATSDGMILRWDLSNIEQIVLKYMGHKREITSMCPLLNKYFISSSEDHTLRIWHVDRSEAVYHVLCSHSVINFVLNLSHIFDDHIIFIGNADSELKVINLNNNAEIQEVKAKLYLHRVATLINSVYKYAILEGDYHIRFINFNPKV